MKIFRLAAIAVGLVLAASCSKPMSEEERNAQIEREVQQRLDAERVAQDKDRLAQQQAELDAREQALADKEAAAGKVRTTAATTPRAAATATPRQRTASTGGSSASGRTTTRDGRPARSYDTFYRKLEPYGAWRETADYGYVWQPERAQRSRDWQPYTDGRWAYTDAGWTWVSEEPFGWATYHYGRWTRLRGVGWVWVPGDEWAPAWVSWRTSDEYVGWAPLPPEARFERRTGIKRWADSYYDIDVGEYVFVPNEEIGAERINRVVVPRERNVSIVTQTTNVTNITYNNTYIVNEGPSYDDLRARSRRPVERLRLERQYEVEEGEQPRASVSGGVIAMVAPLFTREVVERPRTVGEPIRQVVAERAVAVGNDPEAQRARAKMKAEATPPPDAPPKTYEKPTVIDAPAEAPAAQATATPVATPAATATTKPTATATATAEPTATGTATATPRPTATATASPAATATATPSPSPTSTPTPTATPTATPAPTATATATPRATATPDEDEASPTPTATVRTTPVATATPVTAATPAAPTPRATASPAADPDDEATPGSAASSGQDRGQLREAERAERQRQRDEARNAKINQMRATTPPPSRAAEPAATPASAATPARAATPRAAAAADSDPDDATPAPRSTPVAAATPVATPTPRAVAPTAVATAPPTDDVTATATPARQRAAAADDDAEASPTASPAPNARSKKAKRDAAKPSEDVDVTDDAEQERPEGTDEP